jgi:hypothetical protein
MEYKKLRKFNTEFRKKLVSKFDNIKDKDDYIDIYRIIVEDIGTDFSSNRNGIFININILSDKCINKLIEFMDDKINLNITQTENDKINYKSYENEDYNLILKMDHKLSNQEKNIIKRIKNKDLI